MRIREIEVTSFKAYSHFTLELGENAFLVGPNNAGKSTLVAATRATGWMLGHAAKRRPKGPRSHGSNQPKSHRFRADQFGLVTENLRHQFQDEETSVRLETDTQLTLTAVWPPEKDENSAPFFYVAYDDGRPIVDPKTVRELSGPIGAIPGLAPLNHVERVLDRNYVESQSESRRTSQHARNHLLHLLQDGEFNAFREFALDWLPELDGLDVRTRRSADFKFEEIDVFIREAGDRTEKELFWAGDGMQVFMQLLHHLWRLRDADVVVLDEPDLYLHADLQRRLVRILESNGSQTITATHSPEMLAEASSESVIWVDKSRQRGVPRPKTATLADLSSEVGSDFNLRLASALRAQVVLLVEGDDMSILRSVAKTVGANALAQEHRCAVIELTGFGTWVHPEPFEWLVKEFLNDSAQAFVILDRNFRTETQRDQITSQLNATGVNAHVWKRNGLLSYLLQPEAIARISGASLGEVSELFDTATEQMTEELTPHFAGTPETAAELQERRVDGDWRRARYPAKEILQRLNQDLEQRSFSTVSAKAVAAELREGEVPGELAEWLKLIEESVRGRGGR